MTGDLEFGKMVVDEPETRLIPIYDPGLSSRVFSRGPVREDELLIFVRERQIEDMLAHVRRHARQEVGGVLVGGAYVYNTLRWVEVRGIIHASRAVSGGLSLRFTHRTWDAIHEELEARFPGDQVLAWYHSHPKSGIYFSGNDVFIHRNFFSLPWQFAVVADPREGKLGFFQWKGDGVERCGYYFISDSLAIG